MRPVLFYMMLHVAMCPMSRVLPPWLLAHFYNMGTHMLIVAQFGLQVTCKVMFRFSLQNLLLSFKSQQKTRLFSVSFEMQ